MNFSMLGRSFVALFILLEAVYPALAAPSRAEPGLSVSPSAPATTYSEPLIQEAQLRNRARVRVRPVARPARVRPVVRPGLNRPAIVRRPVVAVVRPWRHRPHYGRILAGITLGAIITAAAIGSAPAAPAPNLCWYWLNSIQTEGYWDYCQ